MPSVCCADSMIPRPSRNHCTAAPATNIEPSSALIFDEVDSGVGGGIAEVIGKKLRWLGETRQVFCVTHLAQVASQAHHHFRVEKIKKTDDTTTNVIELSNKERLEEIARMLGGMTITEQTRAHAGEMIAGQG